MWNPVRGRCPHGCEYCYVKSSRTRKLYEGRPKLIEKELTVSLGNGKTIFVGSMIDMWGQSIPSAWILRVVDRCMKFENKYLFQSKNPARFSELGTIRGRFSWLDPKKVILGTTIETNRTQLLSPDAPSVVRRALGLSYLSPTFDTMVSIEPIMNFDVDLLVQLIRFARPKFVSIGADSKWRGLDEPSWAKVVQLVQELSKFTKIVHKANLDRLKR
jgi:DNA repair photolyase